VVPRSVKVVVSVVGRVETTDVFVFVGNNRGVEAIKSKPYQETKSKTQQTTYDESSSEGSR